MYSMIVHSTWEEVLPTIQDSSINLIYTDPPYEMNYRSTIPGSKEWNKTGNLENRFEAPMIGDHKGAVDWEVLLNHFYRILKNDSYLVLHANIPFLLSRGTAFEEAGFTYKGTIAWAKNFAIGGDLRGAMKRDWEPILYLSKGKPSLNPIDVIRNGKIESRNRISEIGLDWTFSLKKIEKVKHPTQKPIALARQIISLMSNPNDIVLDCFAGSGSIPVAAKQAGRKWYAIECDESFYNIIKNRLTEGGSQSTGFDLDEEEQ